MIEYEEFASVWDAIEETPEEAAKMQALGDLMIQITCIVEQNKWSVAEAAERFHTTPVKMNDLLEGRIYRFDIEELVKMAGALGRKVRVEIEAA